MAALTKDDLRDYVLKAQRHVAEGYVLLDFTHNLTSRHFAEIQFHLSTDIEDVKHRIYTHCGSLPEFMELSINGVLLEDGKALGYYGPKDHDVIRIVDHDPNSVAANGGLDDVSQVKKYEMSEEEYSKRKNTYRAWKLEQIAKDPNWVAPWLKREQEEKRRKKAAAAASNAPIEPLDVVLSKYSVGARCECTPGARRGEIKYVGYVGEAPAAPSTPENGEEKAPLQQVWIGVAFDEPLGKNDGSAKGKRYFTCAKNYGAFLKPEFVKVGDFPVRDPFASDDEEEAGACCDKEHAADKECKADGEEDVMEEL